jgi:hypothetical protein
MTAASDKASSTVRKITRHMLTALSCAGLKAAIGPPFGGRRFIDPFEG